MYTLRRVVTGVLLTWSLVFPAGAQTLTTAFTYPGVAAVSAGVEARPVFRFPSRWVAVRVGRPPLQRSSVPGVVRDRPP